MRLYPAWKSESAMQFYVVADDPEELQRLNDEWRANTSDTVAVAGRTRGMLEAFCIILGLWRDPSDRFVRCQYESDGIWRVVLFGPAYEALAWHNDLAEESADERLPWLEARLRERLGLEATA